MEQAATTSVSDVIQMARTAGQVIDCKGILIISIYIYVFNHQFMHDYYVLNSFVYFLIFFFLLFLSPFSVFSLCVSGCMLGSQRASSVAEHSRGPT